MRKLAIGLTAAFMVATVAAPVMATQPPDHKVTICHRTASDTNPYVIIEVDVASLPAHLNNLPGHPEKHGRNDVVLLGSGPWTTDACNPTQYS